MGIALSIFSGLVLLVLGAELLVRGSVRLAERLGVSSLLIGLTVVGFGTSTPELVTSVQAALIGSTGIAGPDVGFLGEARQHLPQREADDALASVRLG